MRTLLAAVLVVAGLPALAGETTGTILAFDRQADVIVLTDKTVWALDAKTLIPADLAAGDVVTITFVQRGDDGVGGVTELKKN